MTESAHPLRRDAQRSRDRLLDAAGTVLEETGPLFTLPDLARHAGVGVATVYRHFPDRSDLLAAYEARAMARTLEAMKAVQADLPAAERFREVCREWVSRSSGEAAPTRFLRSHLGMVERYRAGDAGVVAYLHELIEVLQALVATGELPDQDLLAAALIWVTLLDERTVVDLGRELGWTTEQVADRLSAAVLGALSTLGGSGDR